MKNQDWKLKYLDLKQKFHDAVDVAFRLGYEQGAQGAQLQQAQQDKMAAQQASMGGMGQDPNAEMEQGQPESDGSELDQHIGQLEGMLSQSKPGSMEQQTIQKSLDGIKQFQMNIKQKFEMKKAQKAIASIGKSLKPFKLNKEAEKNLPETAKKALSDQEKIVQDVMKSFEEEDKKLNESITKTLSIEQLLKG